jgi:streptomycin 6-kinase
VPGRGLPGNASLEQLKQGWLAALPEQVKAIASGWSLELGEPYVHDARSAWVAPVRNPAGEELVLKVGWPHWEAQHEADALRVWNGDGAVRCLAARSLEGTTALLLERCRPGRPLNGLPEPEQDVVLAELLRRLWQHEPPAGHRLRSLREMCNRWADSFELDLATDPRGLDLDLAHAAIEVLRGLPATAEQSVLLCTDLHAGNVLSAEREPWLVIDPKPFIGDPAYDAVQHMLNCEERLATDPAGLCRRMAELLGVDPERVKLWLFARCVHESLDDLTLREPARRLSAWRG